EYICLKQKIPTKKQVKKKILLEISKILSNISHCELFSKILIKKFWYPNKFIELSKCENFETRQYMAIMWKNVIHSYHFKSYMLKSEHLNYIKNLILMMKDEEELIEFQNERRKRISVNNPFYQ